jgi:hypothetical protein
VLWTFITLKRPLTWKETRDPEKITKYVNRCLRFILGIWWPNVISNEDLWVRTKQKGTDRPYIEAGKKV